MKAKSSKALVVLSSVCGLVNACGDAKDKAKALENQLIEQGSYQPPAGEPLALVLEPMPGAASIDLQGLMGTLSILEGEDAEAAANLALADDNATVASVDQSTVDYMLSGAEQKESLDTAGIPLDKALAAVKTSSETLSDAEEAALRSGFMLKPTLRPYSFDPSKDTVSLDAASWGNKTEFVIPRLDKIPIRDQGQRGTCAAHTGVGYLEYLLLKKHSSKLTTLDLSEQRFYMMSKPEHWKTGGVVNQDGGSWWPTGYQISMGTYEGGYTAPSDDKKYNIPLESDCPYNMKPGSNELQTAQAKTCTRGAVKVTSASSTYELWYSDGKKELYSDGLRSAQEIIDYLRDKQLPVPILTTITESWQNNDGLITLKAATGKGATVLGAHAYLIVGARKLDSKKNPNEGDMCFIIKNSWGAGWGTKGLSCMTLAYFRKYRTEPYFFDLAFDADIDLDYVTGKLKKTVPKSKKKLHDGEHEHEPEPELVQAEAFDNPGNTQQAQADALGEAAPAAPEISSDGYSAGGLVDGNGGLVKVLYKQEAGQFKLAGVLKGDTDTTGEVVLDYDGSSKLSKVLSEGAGSIEVGSFDSKTSQITLCAGAYARACTLRYVAEGKELNIHPSEDAFYAAAGPAADAAWKTLVTLPNYGIEYASAGGVFVDVRLLVGGEPTNSLRLGIKPVDGAIVYRGRDVGNYQQGALCSGAYRSVCRLVVRASDKKLLLFLKSKRAP